MNEWYEQAAKKLETERNSGSYDRYASAMKGAVCEALDGFCRQDAEFAQAVVQGGTFSDCMKAVAKGCGSAISDLEAYRRALEQVLEKPVARRALYFLHPGTTVEV